MLHRPHPPPSMGRSQAFGGHRVLIAAFSLPQTIELVEEDAPVVNALAQTSAPGSPPADPTNPQQLADMLSVRLQVAAKQQETRSSTPPVRTLKTASGNSGSASSSRHASFTGQRERVNMAELMAEASRVDPSVARSAASSSAVFSNPPSPTRAQSAEESARDSGGDTASAGLQQPRTVTSVSDHGRNAADVESHADTAASRMPPPRSRRGSQAGTPLPPMTTLAPPPTLPAHGAASAPAQAPSSGSSSAGGSRPTSIISDMAAKQREHGASSLPPPDPSHPFGTGAVTPRPSTPAVGSHGRTPRLMTRPEMDPEWNGYAQQDEERPAPAADAGATPAPARPEAADEGPKVAQPAPARPADVHVLPSGRVTLASDPRAVQDSDGEPVQKAPPRAPHGSPRRRPTRSAGRPGRPGSRWRSLSTSLDEDLVAAELPPFEFAPNPSANYGLVNAVNSVAEERLRAGKLYMGTLGIEMDWLSASARRKIDERAVQERDCLPVWFSDKDYVQAYNQYCKRILWPTFHYTLPTYDGLATEHAAFRAYVEVNRRFAERIAEVYEDGDVVWVQDYHLLLVPQMVRERLPNASIGLFVHIAFPSSEIFRCLGMREVLLRGMLGADLVGFQTHNFCRHFRQTVSRILQLEARPRGIQLRDAFVAVAPLPIGLDVHTLNRRRENPEVYEWITRLEERYAGKAVIVGRDKLDWIKGVREKLLAFEVFLDEHPEWVGRVVLVQVALATVQEGEEAAETTRIVARINNKHSSLTYQPVAFLHVQEITFSQYLALLSMADLFLATSLREGMNLTTHEYIVAQAAKKSPLILSEFTGTYSTLRACIGVNPWNARQVAHAIHRALTMSKEEREQRWNDLHGTVVTQTAQHWITSVLSQLERAHLNQRSRDNLFIPRLEVAQLVPEWRAARSRLLLLDLEDTLISEDAYTVHEHGFTPPAQLVEVLRRLAADMKTYVYVLSSKGMKDLDRLAAQLPQVGFVAENGCYLRHYSSSSRAAPWTSLVAGFSLQWRAPVFEILTYFTERTPGSWIEDCGASVCWRYCADPQTAQQESDVQWARRQAAEVQSLIYDSLGERFSLRIVHGRNHFLIMPKNVSRTSAAQYVLGLDSMGKLPCRAATQDAQAASVAAHDAMPPPVLASPIQGPSMHDVPDPALGLPADTAKPMFDFVLQVGRDEHLISYVNQLDLTFAPRTCTTEDMHNYRSSEASFHLAPDAELLHALEQIVDLRRRDLQWGGPAMVDV